MARASLLVWVLWLAILTLFPFDFSSQAAGQQLTATVTEHFARRGPDVLLNAALFMPLGWWLGGEGQRRALRVIPVLLLAAGAGALISLTVELLQLFLPSRFPSLLDVASNTAGSVAGVHVHRRWAPRGTAALARLRDRTSWVTLTALMVAVAGAELFTSAALQAQARLNTWDDSYPLLVGNERTGDRPWRGRVYSIQLTARATPTASLRMFARGGIPVIPGVPIASYDFAGAPPYRDATGSVPNLTWTSGGGGGDTQGVRVSERAWLSTNAAASGLARAVRETDAFSLRVVCATDGGNQNGPARIMSNSTDPLHRNLTIGQQGRDLVVRFRAPHTGANATNPEFVVPGVFVDDGLRDILVTYDGASLRAAVAGSGRVFRFNLTPGSRLAAAWFPDILSRELKRYELTYLASLFLLPGVLVAVFGRRSKRCVAGSAAWVLVFSLLLESTLAMVSGRVPELSGVSTTLAVGAMVFSSAMVIPSRSGRRHNSTV